MDLPLASNHSHATASFEGPLAIEKSYSISRNTRNQTKSSMEEIAASSTSGDSIRTKDAQLGYPLKNADAQSGFSGTIDGKKADEAVSDTRSFRHNTSTLSGRFRRLAPCNINNSACHNREYIPLFMHQGTPKHEKSGYYTNNNMDQMTLLSKETYDTETSRMEAAISPSLSSFRNMVQTGVKEVPNSRLCDIQESKLTSGLARFHKPSSASVKSAAVDLVAESSGNAINYQPYKKQSGPLHRPAAQKPLTAPKLFQVTDRVNAFLQARGKAAPCVKRPRLDDSSERSNLS
jgi:hypothetical protein